MVGAMILPQGFEDVLSTLLDNCPSESYIVIKQVIESEFNCPMEEIFSSFEREPIGSASIGQAHRATLLDGTQVVVKVSTQHMRVACYLLPATCYLERAACYAPPATCYLLLTTHYSLL